MFVREIRKIVHYNKELELQKWLFGINEKIDNCDDEELCTKIMESLQSLREKICVVKGKLPYAQVKNNNFNNVLEEGVYHPLVALSLNRVPELTHDEKMKLDILIIFGVIYLSYDKKIDLYFISNKEVKLTNYDKNENVRNFIKKEKDFDKYLLVAKCNELVDVDYDIMLLNIK